MVSIIIPTYNRSSQLLLTLQSLLDLKTATDLFEIIIVDNGSSDATKSIVGKVIFDNDAISIRYFYDDVPGLLTGRHRGALESKGDVLTFIDDDVCVSPDWLDSILNVMDERKDISFLTGPNLPLYQSYPPKWLDYFWENAYEGKYCAWLSLLDLGSEIHEIHPNFVWGLNFTIRKSVFLALEGFHPDNIPSQYQKFQGDGETGLTIKGFKNGYKALYHPGVLLYHQIPSSRLNFDYFEKRAYYQGVCNSFSYLRANKENGKENDNVTIKSYRKLFNGKIKQFRKRIFGIKNKKQLVIPVDIQNIIMGISKKEKEGFDFHQKMYSENQAVRNWVHQENYINYKLPSQ